MLGLKYDFVKEKINNMGGGKKTQKPESITLKIIISNKEFIVVLSPSDTFKDLRMKLWTTHEKELRKMGFIKTTIVQDPVLDFTVEGKGSLYKHARQGMFKWGFEDNAVITTREMDENERKARKAVKNKSHAKSKAMPKKDSDDKKDKKDKKGTTDDNKGTADKQKGTTDDKKGTTDDKKGTTDDKKGTTDDKKKSTDDKKKGTDKSSSSSVPK